MKFIRKAFDGFQKGIKKILKLMPPVERFFYSRHYKYRIVKGILGFPVGFLIGIMVYYICLHGLNINPETRMLLGLFVACLFGIGFGSSRKIRCVLILLLPTFAGKSGRTVLTTLAMAILIAGPITNIVNNFQEVVHVLACVATINFNLTKQRFSLMFSPVKEVIKEYAAGAKSVRKSSAGIRDSFLPVEQEVEDDSEVPEMKKRTNQVDGERDSDRTDRIDDKYKKKKTDSSGQGTEKKYKEKLDYRCEDVFNFGVKKCEEAFYHTEQKCYEAIPVVGILLCWPMKLTFMCKIVSWIGGSTVCNSNNVVNPGFGEGFEVADNASEEFGKNFDVNMNYKVVSKPVDMDLKSAKDVAKKIKQVFSEKKTTLMYALSLIQRILAIFFIMIFVGCVKYHNKFVKNIQFDNVYTTSYFKHIDHRRAIQGKMTLLPLKKFESKTLTDRATPKYLKSEKKKFSTAMIILVPQILTSITIIIFDYIFCEVLLILRKHGTIEFQQKGFHKLKLSVEGTGVIARMIRKILKGFDKQKGIDSHFTTSVCLPNPTRTSTWSIICIFLLYFGVIVLLYFHAYTLRLRSKICGFFYHKWEKKRILILYNDTLKKRKGLLKHLRHEVKKKAKEKRLQSNISIAVALRKQSPKLFGWLKIFGKQKCLICEDPENKSFVTCPTPGCGFVYCEQCWIDVRGVCYACTPESDKEESDVTDEGGKQDDDTD